MWIALGVSTLVVIIAAVGVGLWAQAVFKATHKG